MVARKKPDAAAEAQAVFKEIDADGDGKLNAEEVKKHKGTSDKLIAMFKKYDKNGDGTMSKQELTGVFKALDKKLSDVEIEVAFSSADRNSDGKIDVEEFILWITGTTGKGDGINARSRMQEEFAKSPLLANLQKNTFDMPGDIPKMDHEEMRKMVDNMLRNPEIKKFTEQLTERKRSPHQSASAWELAG